MLPLTWRSVNESSEQLFFGAGLQGIFHPVGAAESNNGLNMELALGKE
jgi:hypothetical protein